MHRSLLIKQARNLRQDGFSYNAISNLLGVSKSTAYLWVSKTPLSQEKVANLELIKENGRKIGLKKITELRNKKRLALEEIVQKDIQSVQFSRPLFRLGAALLYWGEGGKTDSALSFMNSDPNMIKTFLYFLRLGWHLDESKFRIKIHVHDYHNLPKLTNFWASVTGIDMKQFSHPYIKSNTGKVKRQDYKGCITIRYYDVTIAHQLRSYLRQLPLNIGP